jgi:ribulose-bisphosphate carboxylase small chain
VWPIEGKKKFETLSYLPDLSPEELLKQIEYLIRSNWIPCLEFSKVKYKNSFTL